MAHRLLSILYPVRYYACTPTCGWKGILPSVSRLQARKRRLLRVALLVLLALCGIALARHLAPYWQNQHSDESVEESEAAE